MESQLTVSMHCLIIASTGFVEVVFHTVGHSFVVFYNVLCLFNSSVINAKRFNI